MGTLGTLFAEYGALLVFLAVLLEQIGPPLPSGPLLMVAGALVDPGAGLWIGAVAWVAAMLGKVALYVVGERYGTRAKQVLCKFAVAPDSSIARADTHFERWGPPLLIVAEFIPGIRTLAPSLAGAEKLAPTPFLIYSALGATLWTGLYLGLGLLFRNQIGRALEMVERSGKVAVVAIAVAGAVYFAVKWWRRRRSVKSSC